MGVVRLGFWAEDETRRGAHKKGRSRAKPGIGAHVASFNFTNTMIWPLWSTTDFAADAARRLLLSPAPCQNGAMPRIDRYDVIGMVLLALVAALWIVHFSLPQPPPEIVLP
jgi:hypothetical protein